MNSHELANQLNDSDKNNRERTTAALGHQRTALTPLCVADAMTTDVVTLNPYNTFAEVVSLMAKHPFRHFLVLESPGRLVGVISDRDVLRALARTVNWQTTFASDLMTSNVLTVQPQSELSLAAAAMLEKRINCLPVVNDKGDTCGIITSSDLLKSYRDLQERLEKENKLGASVATIQNTADAALGKLLER